MAYDNLINIIGLTEKECVCYAEQPAEWATLNASKSGYYIDNVEYCIDLKFPAVGDCADADIYDILQEVRQAAINDLVTQFLVSNQQNKIQRFGSREDTVGDINGNATVLKNKKQFVGFVLSPKAYRGVSQNVNKIGLQVSVTGDYDVSVYDMDDLTTAKFTETVSAVANKIKYTSTLTHNLPFYKDGRSIKYLFVYERLTANPFNIKTTCGCGANKLPDWHKSGLFDITGISADTVADFEDDYTVTTGTTHGIVVEFDTECNSLAWIDHVNDNFWSNDAFGRVFAKIFQLNSNLFLLNKLLDVRNISFYTLVDKEAMYGKRSKLVSMIQEMIPYLSNNMPEGITDCYNSRPVHGHRKSTMLT